VPSVSYKVLNVMHVSYQWNAKDDRMVIDEKGKHDYIK